MPDIPPLRTSRSDRRLIATITDSPQLIKYFENLGIDMSGAIPDAFAELLQLIIDAAESAGSAQGAANRALQELKDLSNVPPPTSDQRVQALRRQLDDIESQLLDLRLPSVDVQSSGEWTPTITFATPGDIAVTYAIRTGSYVKIGRQVFVWFFASTSAFTWTTSAGNLLITGLPFPCATPTAATGVLDWSGITKATFTQINLQFNNGGTSIMFRASGSGVARALVVAADVPSAGTVVLSGHISYFI